MDETKIKSIHESGAEESKKLSSTEIIGEILQKNFKDGEVSCELHYLGTRKQQNNLITQGGGMT